VQHFGGQFETTTGLAILVIIFVLFFKKILKNTSATLAAWNYYRAGDTYFFIFCC
jgi:hypothetical protein